MADTDIVEVEVNLGEEEPVAEPDKSQVEDKTPASDKPDEKVEPKADDKPDKPDESTRVFEEDDRQWMFEEGIIDKDGKPGPNSKRFGEIYRERKDLQRALEKSLDDSPVFKELSDLIKHQKGEIAELRKGQQSEAVESKRDKLDAQIKVLKVDRKTAGDNVDFDKVDEINEKISKLSVDIKMLETDEGGSSDEPVFDAAKAEETANHALDVFKRANPWFNENDSGYDENKAALAIVIDKKLRNDSEWKNKPLIERYEEVSKRVVAKANKKDVPPQPDGSTQDTGKGATKTVSLTQSQITIAKKLGITPEAYAKSLVEMENE